MDYYNNDDHDEDDLPEISMTHYTRKNSSDDEEEENNHSTKPLEDWRNLYETSIHSLQSDEEETPKPSYLERQISIEKPSSERPDSPISELEIDSNTNKPKWEIRLPELLNSMVGPDRQKREVSRRHTTNIVFQQSQDSISPSLDTENHRPINPLVKQLKQKFDLMTTSNATIDNTNNHSPTSKLQRVGSLTCRGLTANTNQRLIQRPRPMLPIRPTPEITPMKSRSGSIGSVNSRLTITTNRNKPGPPVSYPKHYYPPPSTTSVVKQLIGSGATLIYDSRSQINMSKHKPSIIKHQRSFEQTRKDLKNTHSLLTGRQSAADYAEIRKPLPSKDDESDENYYEPMLDRTSYNSSRRKSIESSNHHRNGNDNDNDYPVYDMDRKK